MFHASKWVRLTLMALEEVPERGVAVKGKSEVVESEQALEMMRVEGMREMGKVAETSEEVGAAWVQRGIEQMPVVAKVAGMLKVAKAAETRSMMEVLLLQELVEVVGMQVVEVAQMLVLQSHVREVESSWDRYFSTVR